MKRIFFIIISLVFLIGCSKTDNPSAEGGADSSPYPFVYNEVTLRAGEAAASVIAELDGMGIRLNYFEAPSCAFEGLDKIFYYTGFEIYTYPVDGEDYISSICLVDDSVTTDKGIYLGQGLDKVIEAYGDSYVQEMGQYTYKQGDYSLSFLIEEDEVIAITYAYDNI